MLLAECYLDLDRADDALPLAHRADAQAATLLSAAPTDPTVVAVHRSTMRTLARTHRALGAYEPAATHYRQLIRTFQQDVTATPSIEGDIKLSQILEEAAECWLLVGRPEAAIDLLTGATTRWRRICRHPSATAEHREKFAWCLQLLARAETDLGRPRDAAARLAEANTLTAT